MTTSYRNGKIARLPKPIREELNHRLANNESSRELLPWLNAHPDVQKILAQNFAGRPILQQNLSEWRRGGYEEWLQHQETRDFTRQLLEESEDFNHDLNAKKIGEALATSAAADFARTSKTKIGECKDTDQRLDCLNNVLRQASRLRRNDYHADCQSLRRERWDYKIAAGKKTAEAASSEEERRQMLAWFNLQPDLAAKTQKYGGSDKAYDHAAFLLELEHKLRCCFLGRKKAKESPAAFDEFCEIATEDEVARGVTSDIDEINASMAAAATAASTTPSEGRVPQVPNISINSVATPVQSASANDLRSTQHAVPPPTTTEAPLPPGAIALSNDCTHEEFAARNHPPSTVTQARYSCLKKEGKTGETKWNKPQQTRIKSIFK